jgi:hypothetical protein
MQEGGHSLKQQHLARNSTKKFQGSTRSTISSNNTNPASYCWDREWAWWWRIWSRRGWRRMGVMRMKMELQAMIQEEVQPETIPDDEENVQDTLLDSEGAETAIDVDSADTADVSTAPFSVPDDCFTQLVDLHACLGGLKKKCKLAG